MSIQKFVRPQDLIWNQRTVPWKEFQYKTPHTLSDLLTPGYFDPARERFEVDDRVIAICETDDHNARILVDLIFLHTKSPDRLEVAVLRSKELPERKSAE